MRWRTSHVYVHMEKYVHPDFQPDAGVNDYFLSRQYLLENLQTFEDWLMEVDI